MWWGALQFPVCAFSKFEALQKSLSPTRPWALTPASSPLRLRQTLLCSASQPPCCLSQLNSKLLGCFWALQLPFFSLPSSQLPWENLWAGILELAHSFRGKSMWNVELPHFSMLPSLWNLCLSRSLCFGSSEIISKKFKKIYPAFWLFLEGAVGLPPACLSLPGKWAPRNVFKSVDRACWITLSLHCWWWAISLLGSFSSFKTFIHLLGKKITFLISGFILVRPNAVSNDAWCSVSSVCDLPLNLHYFSLIFKNCIPLPVLISKNSCIWR